MTEKRTKKNSKPEQETAAEVEMVSIPLKDYSAQLEELDELRRKSDEFSNGWQRERAEFANYRKRVERDQQSARQDLIAESIRQFLDVHDDLERAFKHAPTEGDGKVWADGVRLIAQKLKTIFDTFGVKPIEAQNTEFDPAMHEAVTHEENGDVPSGHVIEVVKQGYTIGDRVIRPALVRVAK